MRKFFIKADLTADENEEGRISGYASVYGNIDSYSEVIDKGAFSEILADIDAGKVAMPLMLANHEHYSGCPIGIWDKLWSDEKGLGISGLINPEVSQGKDIYSSLKFAEKHGTMAKMGLSVGFYIANDSYEIIEGVGHIKKVSELKEVSIVCFPANDQAVITSVKSIEKGDNLEIIKALKSKRDFEKFLRDSGICSKKEAETFISVFSNVIKMSECDTSGNDDYSQLSAKLDSILNRSF